MTLIAMWGFDDATAPEPGTAANKSATGRLGTDGSVLLNNANQGPFTVTLPSVPGSTTVFGVALNSNQFSTGSILSFLDGNAVVHVTVSFDTSGHLVAARGGTTLATSTLTLSASTWYYVEVKLTISDTVGLVEVRVNGTVWLTFSGDTKNAGTSSILSSVSLARTNTGSGTTIMFDDAYVLDTTGSAPFNDYLGDIAVQPLYPTGDGASSGWLGSDGNSVSNWDLVEETPAVQTDYVAASVTGTRDLYTMSDLAAGRTPLAVQEMIYAAKSDAGTAPVLKPVSRSGAGTVRTEAATLALGTTYLQYNGTIQTTDPDGAAWTVSSVNALQVGVEIG